MMKLQDLFKLNGRIALVTGGGRGVGKYIATGLAEAGADLIIVGRKMMNLEQAAVELETNFGVKVLPILCDMGEKKDIEKMLDIAKDKFGRVDILVNNAGVIWVAPTLDFPLEKWDQIFNVNIRGVWILTQRIARIMKEQGGGNIINISSFMSFRGSDERSFPSVPYRASKAALNILTMDLAVKLAPYNIRVNGIALGHFMSNMTAHFTRPESKPAFEAALDTIPMRRFADVDDIKGVAVCLASSASTYMTGHVLVNDGGWLAR